jgi:hypothetical protein
MDTLRFVLLTFILFHLFFCLVLFFADRHNNQLTERYGDFVIFVVFTCLTDLGG